MIRVKYLPEPYDCYEFELLFECAEPEHQKVHFALGPSEMKEFHKYMKRAMIDRALHKPMEQSK